MKKIARYVSFIIRNNPVGFLTSCFLYVFHLLFAVGLYGMSSFLISIAALRPSYDTMMIPVVSVRLFGLGRAVLSYTQRYCSHDSTFRILKDLRLKLYDKMLPELPNYETKRAENLSKLISDVELLQEGILRLVYPIFSSFIIFIIGIYIAYLFHPYLAILFAILFLIHYYIFPLIMFGISKKRKTEIDDDKKKLYQDLLELKEGISEITSNGRQEEWILKIQDRLSSMNGGVGEQQKAVAFCEAMITFFQGMSMVWILFVASYLCLSGELSGIYLAAAVLTLTTLVTEEMLPSQTYFKLNGIKRAADSVFEKKPFKENSKSIKTIIQKEEKKGIKEGEHLDENTLYLSHISWKYKEGKKVFDDFSMTLRKGTLVTILGKSGIGKSTLVNLILGFLQVEEGTIFLGEMDLQKMEEEERLKLFSVVDQTPFFFHQTIFENMQLVKPDMEEEQVMEVIRKVSLENVISSSSKGIHTSLYEWGDNLSGGELKRLAIARALLKEAPFYIFDEPTAGLDTINEKLIMDLIRELLHKHGVLLITHRPDILEKNDIIVSLSEVKEHDS